MSIDQVFVDALKDPENKPSITFEEWFEKNLGEYPGHTDIDK